MEINIEETPAGGTGKEITGKRVIVVEDDRFLGDLLASHLRKNGIAAEIFTESRNGLEAVHSTPPPALVILDLLMPEMDGFEFLQKLKDENLTPGLPVMIFSNLGEREEVEHALSLGAKDFLIKAHFDLDGVTEKVKEILASEK